MSKLPSAEDRWEPVGRLGGLWGRKLKKTTPTLPSAEELAEKMFPRFRTYWDEERAEYRQIVEGAADDLRAYGRAVLEAAAQEALDHPEAPAEAILKLREKL